VIDCSLNGSSLLIIEPESDHVDQLASNLRVHDHVELLRYRSIPVRDQIALCVENSVYARVALIDWHVAVMWGVVPWNVLGGVGSPWCLTSNTLNGHGRAFARMSRFFLKEVKRLCPGGLAVQVDAQYDEAVRWVKWLGFTLTPSRVNGNDFYWATMKETDDGWLRSNDRNAAGDDHNDRSGGSGECCGATPCRADAEEGG